LGLVGVSAESIRLVGHPIETVRLNLNFLIQEVVLYLQVNMEASLSDHACGGRCSWRREGLCISIAGVIPKNTAYCVYQTYYMDKIAYILVVLTRVCNPHPISYCLF